MRFTDNDFKSKIISYSIFLGFLAVVFSSLQRYIADSADRTRCKGMLNGGWWLDQGHEHWQPSGCMSHNYNIKEASACLKHSNVLYIGDSVMREQFYSMVRFFGDIETPGSLHLDRHFEFKEKNVVFDFWWDPYLNKSHTVELLEGRNKNIKPSLLAVGSGVWYILKGEQNYFEQWKVAINRILKSVQETHTIADAILLSPVEIPVFHLLDPSLTKDLTLDKIEKMNSYLKEKEGTLSSVIPFNIPFVWNDLATSTINSTMNGLHYFPVVTKIQANLAINYRCNDQLSKTFPIATTCCMSYPAPKWFQLVWFLLFLVCIPVCFLLTRLEGRYPKFVNTYFVPSEKNLIALFTLGLCVIYMYIGDRTHLFEKIHKEFHANTFHGLLLFFLGVGLLTLKSKPDGDQGFLNRSQTDEWKGWMQIIILVYHYTGASTIEGIYNPIRVLVAAYLFQTGYGHFFFFYEKGDYGFGRVLNVMVRLNLLTFVLQYLMNTDYLSYYFTPLVSFWFGIIWITMYIGNAWNKTPLFILAKIFIMSILSSVFIHTVGILETVFDLLQYLFNIHWNVVECRFRLSLDSWIVYVGMLCAYTYIKLKEHKMNDHFLWPLVKIIFILTSIAAMIWYFIFELSQPSKTVYNSIHPLISWIPILSFIILRNACRTFRNTSSTFFEFIGKCSLETFIGQFHMWLAGDTKGLLFLLVNPTWAKGSGWWINLCFSSVFFVAVSYYLSQATGEITRWICSDPSKKKKKNDYMNIPTEASALRSSIELDNISIESQTASLMSISRGTVLGKKVDSTMLPMEDSSGVISLDRPMSVQKGSQKGIEEESFYDEYPSESSSFLSWWKAKLLNYITDIRFKIVLWIIGVGIVNHFC